MHAILEVLPLTIVMIAGPQIISAVFFATSERWGANTLAYLAGAVVSMTVVVTIAYLVTKGAKNASAKSHKGTVDDVIDSVIVVLIAFMVVHTFVKRKVSEPPKWMGRLQTATPRLAFTLGFLMLGVFPTDIASSFAAGAHLARDGAPWVYSLAFVGGTVLLLAIPSLCVVFLGERAHVLLPRVRDWMNENSWVISECVLVFFLVLTVKSLAS